MGVLHMANFLVHIAAAAKSTIALAAYVIVVAAWSLRAWMQYRPQRKAKEILALYSSDAERTRALAELLGNQPPKGLRQKEVLAWVAMQTKQRSRVLWVLAFLVTLITAVIIVAMALFYQPTSEASKPPKMTDVKVIRP